jgi:hypothetical protein
MIKAEKLGINKSGVNLFNLGDIVEVIEEEEDSDEEEDYRNKKLNYDPILNPEQQILNP